MIPGPVFAVELLTIARRARYYALRMLYGLGLIVILWMSYTALQFAPRPGGPDLLTPNEISRFAQRTFLFFVVGQVLAVAAIVPAIVGGTIAGEKQRKTLHYLLASSLTSGEIVLGKLLARMLLVFVYILAGVPFLFILRTLGGIPADLILASFGLTTAFALYLSAQSIFFSTVMRQARTAILFSYGTLIAWFVAPWVALFGAVLFPRVLGWLPWNLAYVSPLPDLFWTSTPFRGGRRSEELIRMVIAQGLYVVAFVAYSTWRLRSIAANQTAKPRLVLRLDNRGRASWKPLPRPAIGDAPMLWKERFTSRAGGIAKMLSLLNNLFWATLAGCLLFDYARTALAEFVRSLVSHGAANATQRQEFLNMIRGITPCVSGAWLLTTASSAASSIASEREDDTWISLVSTDLEGREILRAKMLGAVLRSRWLGIMLLVIWGVGVIGGAVHPYSFLIATCEMAVFVWFAAALGVRFSLTSASTSKALALTLAVLVFLNGGYLLFCLPLAPYGSNLANTLVMPWLLGRGLFGAEDLARLDASVGAPAPFAASTWDQWPVLPSVIGVSVYAILAAYYTATTFSRFDAVVDRPTLLMRGAEA